MTGTLDPDTKERVKLKGKTTDTSPAARGTDRDDVPRVETEQKARVEIRRLKVKSVKPLNAVCERRGP